MSQQSSTCSGTLTANEGSGVIMLTGGSVEAGETCPIVVEVIATEAGSLINVTGDLTSILGNSGPTTAVIEVLNPPIPTLGEWGVFILGLVMLITGNVRLNGKTILISR